MDETTEQNVSEQRERELRKSLRGWRDFILYQILDLRWAHALLMIGATECILAPAFGLKLAAYGTATCFAGVALKFASAGYGNAVERFVNLYELEVARAMEQSKINPASAAKAEIKPSNRFPI